MSGGGGGGGDFPPPGKDIDCSDLEFETTLSSPQPDVTALSVGDVLEVDLRDDAGVRSLTVRQSGGDVVGAITSHVAELLNCIQRGFDYEAEVVEIDDGEVRVLVRVKQ